MSGADEQHGQRHSRIPEFASREEEAEFWDTHDITDYWDELKPVKVKFSDRIDHGVIVVFESDTFNQIVEIARERGIFPDALIHTWIVERLKKTTLSEKKG